MRKRTARRVASRCWFRMSRRRSRIRRPSVADPRSTRGSTPNGKPTKALHGFRAVVRRRCGGAGKARNRQGRVVRAPRAEEGPADRGARARDPRRSAEGVADSEADALGRSRLQLRASGALARDAARRGRRRRRDSRPQVRTSFARPSLPSSATGAYRRRRCVARCNAQREGARRSRRAPRARARRSRARGDAKPAACRVFPMRSLDEIANLTEWPVAIACAFDRDIPRRAAGSAGHDDGDEPEVRPGVRRGRQAHRAFHRRRQHRIERSGRNPQRLRARDPSALRRCEILLRRRSQAAARRVPGCAEDPSRTSRRSAASGTSACASPSFRA